MDRADDRGSTATTRVLPAPRVTLNWQAIPFTCKEKAEKKWIKERSGRKVLQTPKGNGRYRYWRAPRPRPRMYRRSRRREKSVVIKAALSTNVAVPENLQEAQVAITVLQAALRSALQREDALKDKLKQSAERSNKLVRAQPGNNQLQKNEAAESGFTGVTRNKSGWSAHTERQQGVRKHLGTFDTPVQAARARRDHCAGTSNVAAVPEAEDQELDLRTPGEIKFDMKLTPHQYHMRKHYHQLAQQRDADADAVAAIQAQASPKDWLGVLQEAFECSLLVILVLCVIGKFWP